MQIEFIEPASIEMDDAIEYFELQLKGLDKIFFEEVLETTELISQFPDFFSKNSSHTRKALLRKSPFSIIYTLYIDNIYIVAVAHQNRQPEYWIDRI